MGFFQTMCQLFESKSQKTARLKAEHDRERKLVLGRLAASNIASYADTQTADRLKSDVIAANKRVESFQFRDPNVTKWRSDVIVEAIVWMLQNSELTIQFPPDKLFALNPDLLGGQLKNVWDLPEIRSGKYLQNREEAESRLFDYSGTSAPYARQFGDVGLHQEKKLYLNASFSTASRPLYSAINFLRFQGGGAGLSYGDAALSLYPHVALNSTFTEQDSFKVTSVDKLATYHNLYPLITNCNENLLNALAEVACLNKPQWMSPGYLEAQNHCPVVFNRDVASIRMSTAAFNNLNKKQKDNLNTFLNRNGLRTRFTKYASFKDQMPLTTKKPVEMIAIDV